MTTPTTTTTNDPTNNTNNTGNTGNTGQDPAVDPTTGQQQVAGKESNLSNWVGPYVTDMLGRAQALTYEPYQAYTGPLTAGESDVQQQAFSGLANLAIPTDTMGSFTAPGVADRYMNPYLDAALEPQIAEARRQAEIQRQRNNARLTRAGAYGGSRQAVLESENDRNLLRNLRDITGAGYNQAFQQARDQFNTENQFGLAALNAQLGAGQQQRAIEQEGITADMQQFEEERDFPYKQIQYAMSLLQGLPTQAQSVSYVEPSQFAQISNTANGLGSVLDWLRGTFGGGNDNSSGTPPAGTTNSSPADTNSDPLNTTTPNQSPAVNPHEGFFN